MLSTSPSRARMLSASLLSVADDWSGCDLGYTVHLGVFLRWIVLVAALSNLNHDGAFALHHHWVPRAVVLVESFAQTAKPDVFALAEVKSITSYVQPDVHWNNHLVPLQELVRQLVAHDRELDNTLRGKLISVAIKAALAEGDGAIAVVHEGFEFTLRARDSDRAHWVLDGLVQKLVCIKCHWSCLRNCGEL